VKNVIHLSALERTVDIKLEKFEVPLPSLVLDIRYATGEQVVDGNHRVTFRDQSVAKMRAQKAGTTGDQCARSHERVLFFTFGTEVAELLGSGLIAGLPTL
jgi:hypothetical protein